MDERAIDPKLLHPVWLAAGKCLAAAQAFEYDVKYLLWLLARTNAIDLPLEAATALMEGQDKRTLGRLLQTMRQHVTFDPSAEESFRAALHERNRFVHGFLSDRAELMASPNARHQIIVEINGIRKVVRDGDSEVRFLIDNLLSSLGIDPVALQTDVRNDFERLNGPNRRPAFD